jgi:hypothetical protein
MRRWNTLCVLLLFFTFTSLRSQEHAASGADTVLAVPQLYDPFGPDNSPDHSGQGSGGVITPSPYDNLTQTFYTRTNSDYYGVQYTFDSPWQAALGVGWTAYAQHESGMQFKLRTSGIRQEVYDPLREEFVPAYVASSELSFDRAFAENSFRAFKFRTHFLIEPKSLGMAGIGMLVSRGNLMVAGDRAMDRKVDVEATWIQVAGGYIMPLSPYKGGINIAIALGVELLGLKYETHYSNQGQFIGGKIGWLAGFGWNANTLVNIGLYAGGEWSFSTGGLHTPTSKVVFSDVTRNSLHVGLQFTGRWFNVVSGIQREWENLDSQFREVRDKTLRYYAGANLYFRR